MEIFKEIFNSSHHAFLIETNSRDIVFNSIKEELSKNKKTNEDLFLNLQIFDIQKSREIIDYGKFIFNEQHFIVVSFYSINREAQNTLLKFLEEPTNNLKVIFIAHNGAKILNTIYSRLYKINYFDKENSKNDSDFSLKFLKTKKLERMKMKEIIDLLEKKDEYAFLNEDKERSDREAVEIFIINLYEKLFSIFKKESENIIKTEKTQKIEEIKENLLELKEFLKYIKNNSSSSKTILEYLSFKLIEI